HLADAEIAHAVARPACDVAAAVTDRAARRAQHARDGADERGLARAIGADDRDNRALLHFERNTIERLRVAVEHIDVLYRQHQIASAPRYDEITAGSRTTSAGAPSAIGAPWCSTSTRFASAITARITCSISRMVSP